MHTDGHPVQSARKVDQPRNKTQKKSLFYGLLAVDVPSFASEKDRYEANKSKIGAVP
jgi:hypothetical protein